jgi:molybdopterin-guanine dinucleotide biosynthesis protein A
VAKLRLVLDEARRRPEAGCILPVSADGRVQPLCAAYHKRYVGMISDALTGGTRKVTDALPGDSVCYINMTDDPVFQNINTPEEWSQLLQALDR